MTKLILLAVIFYLGVSSSYTRRMDLGNLDSLRKNIAELLQDKLNFSDANIPYYEEELTDTTPQNNDEYDFIVIGAGSAGATIASRLSEDTKTTVLLIEAGIKEYPIMDIPGMAGALQLSTQINWMYETESSNKYCLGFRNSKCLWHRAKVMGGDSVFNYMLATRGNKKDYDGWANSTSDESWSFKEMLKYFKKLEKFQVRGVEVNNKYHNNNGPLYIERAPYRTEFAETFIKANEELGIPLTDYNGPEQIGVSYLQLNTHDGERWSANRGYLHPARCRTNLFLTRNSHANKILIDEKTRTAHGVQFTKDDKNIMVRAKKEIILSAGAINSPQLLMLSGIGPAKHLNDLGIRVIRDAPVGENLMDHISYGGLIFKVNDSDTYTDPNILDPSDPTIETYLTKRNGLLTLPPGLEVLSYVNVNNEKLLDYEPNIEILFAPTKGIIDPMFSTLFGVKDEYKDKILADNIKQSTLSMWPLLMNSRSRGKLLLRSKDPNAKPKLYANYLDDPEDVRILIGGIRTAIKLTKTKAFEKYGLELYDTPLPCDMFKFDSDDYWECASRTFTISAYHYSGTCKMGKKTDETAVVDSKLKVIGLKGLRVVDASIMPEIVRAHTHIPVVAIAEKVSDEIKQEWNIGVVE